MKKFFATIVSVLMLVFGVMAFAACGDAGKEEEQGETKTVSVYLPDGTPALAVAKAFTEGVDIDGYEVSFRIINAGSIGQVFATTQADLAIMPTIGAATVASKGQAIRLVSSNVFGNLYIAGVNTQADTLASLKGKVVYTTAATTIQLLQYLLTENGIESELGSTAASADKVYLQSCEQGSEVIQYLAAAKQSGAEALGVLGEPQLTQCQAKVDTAQVVVDLQAEWKELTGFESYPQASLIVRSSFVSENGAFLTAFGEALKGNAAWLEEEENIAAFQAALGEYNKNNTDYQTTMTGLNFTVTTIERCNLGYKSAAEVKDSVEDYVTRLGVAQLPDGFFYEA